MADIAPSLEDTEGGASTGISVDAGGCESTWLGSVKFEFVAMDGSIDAKSEAVIKEGFDSSGRFMFKGPRGYEEAEKSQLERSGVKNWLEVARSPIPEGEDWRPELGVSAASLLCSEGSEVEEAEDAAYTHCVRRLAQREQVG